MNDSNNVDLYGPNAILSGELTEDEIKSIQLSNDKGAEVMDGDQLIEADITDESEEQDEGGDDQPKDQPEDSDKDPLEGTKDTLPEDAEIAKTAQTAQTALTKITSDLTSKGVDVVAIMAEYEASQGLSEETYKTLQEKGGMDRVVVDSLIMGQVAARNSFANSVLQSAGGEKGLSILAEFATKFDPSSVDAYNEAVDRLDLKTAKAILSGWKAQRQNKLGTANPQITGKPSASTKVSAKGFENQQEMTKAINDKRYGRDIAYTKEVEQRVYASKFF